MSEQKDKIVLKENDRALITECLSMDIVGLNIDQIKELIRDLKICETILNIYLREIEEKQLFIFYHSFLMTDKNIAKMMDLKREEVMTWRLRRGLPKNNGTRGGSREIQQEKRRADYDLGLTDKELAEKWDVAVGSVYRWRQKHRLLKNYR